MKISGHICQCPPVEPKSRSSSVSLAPRVAGPAPTPTRTSPCPAPWHHARSCARPSDSPVAGGAAAVSPAMSDAAPLKTCERGTTCLHHRTSPMPCSRRPMSVDLPASTCPTTTRCNPGLSPRAAAVATAVSSEYSDSGRRGGGGGGVVASVTLRAASDGGVTAELGGLLPPEAAPPVCPHRPPTVYSRSVEH